MGRAEENLRHAAVKMARAEENFVRAAVNLAFAAENLWLRSISPGLRSGEGAQRSA
jgi:hypothetical protein